MATVKGGPAWGKGFKIGIIAGLIVTIAGLFFVPALINSCVGDVAYWVNLFAVSAGFGAAAAALIWPIGAMFSTHD